MQARTLLTIVTEAVLEPRLIDDCQRLGAHGYTITDARGGGGHGKRRGSFEFNGNIRVEVLCEPVVAEGLLEHLRKSYAQHYQLVAWLVDVSMLDSSKP